LKPENIRVLKVESKQQLADIFTKGLAKATFESIWELFIGWGSSRWFRASYILHTHGRSIQHCSKARKMPV